MIEVDDKVINLIEKIRRAIREGGILPESFPMEELSNLIELTLGKSFWKCVGSKANYAFMRMPEVYKECLQEALEKRDMEECNNILHLYECTYMALYTVLNEDEKVFRQKPYRKMIIDLGTANAQMQYRQHEERQKGLADSGRKKLGEGRGAVYTCVFGEKKPLQPEEVDARVDYLCFTDKKEKWGEQDGVWKYCPMEISEETGKKMLEDKYKILAHEFLPEYDYSIWVEQDIIVVGDILRFCQAYGDGRSFLGFPHPQEDCIYEEMSVAELQSDELNIDVRKRLHHFRKEGYPEHNGLIDNRVMVRNHRDEELRKVMEDWWNEIDSCGWYLGNVFNYVAWKHKFPFSICNLFIYENPYFRNSKIDLDTNEEL